jgi:hypothetical protein
MEGVSVTKHEAPSGRIHTPWSQNVNQAWALEVGRVMMAFGTFEAITHDALDDLLPNGKAAPIQTVLMLSQRIDLLLALLDMYSLAIFQAFANVLVQVQKVTAQRNLIAHAALGADVYLNEADKSVTYAQSIRSQRNKKKSLDLGGLVQLREEVEALQRQLNGTYTQVALHMRVAKKRGLKIVANLEKSGQ